MNAAWAPKASHRAPNATEAVNWARPVVVPSTARPVPRSALGTAAEPSAARTPSVAA